MYKATNFQGETYSPGRNSDKARNREVKSVTITKKVRLGDKKLENESRACTPSIRHLGSEKTKNQNETKIRKRLRWVRKKTAAQENPRQGNGERARKGKKATQRTSRNGAGRARRAAGR